jgi:hypothetical protein
MDKSYYDKDFESVLKDFEKKGSLVKKGEAIEGKSYFKSAGQYPAVSNIPKSDTSTFLKRRLKLSGPIGAAATVGALAGVALEKGINKIKSMKEKDAKPTPSEVESKKKGGMVRFKKQYQMHNGKF